MPLPVIRYRLLSITMLMSFLLLGVKVGDVFRGGQELSKALVNQASAQQESDKGQAPASSPSPSKPTTDVKPAPATDGTQPIDAIKASPATDKAPDQAAAAEGGEKPASPATTEAAKPEGDVTLPGVTPAAPDASKKIESKKEFSQMDVDLLQSLSRRRDEIESWAKQVELKENMLGATEQRIRDKIAQLKDLQKQLDTVLALYNQHEDAKIRSLVKIYENMKPADAARIFDELEMPIMLEVVDKMSERKAAPIFANMNPTKAKELTVELAAQRKLQQPMVDAISASQAEGASDTPPAPVADSKNAAPAAPASTIPAAPAAPAAPSPSASAR